MDANPEGVAAARAEEFRAKGNAALSAGEFTSAIRHFSDAIVYAPTDCDLYFDRSVAYASLGDWQSSIADVSGSLINFYEALSDAQTTVKLEPSWWKGYARLGSAYGRIHNHAEAIKACKQGLEIDPDNEALKAVLSYAKDSELRLGKGGYCLGSDMWGKLALDPLVRMIYLRQPDFVNTLKLLQSDPDLLPDFRKDFRGSVALHVLDNNRRKPLALLECINNYDTAVEGGRYFYPKIDLLEQEKDLDCSMKQYNFILAMEANNRGLSTLSNCKFSDAVGHFADAIKYTPANPVLYCNRSYAYLCLGKWHDRSISYVSQSVSCYYKALSDAKKTVELKPDWGRGYYRLSAAYTRIHKYTKAIEVCREGLKSDPDWKSLKSLLFSTKRALEVVKNNKKNKRNKQRNAPALPLDSKRKRPADEDQQSVKVQKREPETEPGIEDIPVEERAVREGKISLARKMKIAGNAAYMRNEFKLAIKHYTEGIKLNETDISFFTELAGVYLEMGMNEECVKNCDSAVERGRKLKSDCKIFVAQAQAKKSIALFRMAKKLYEAAANEEWRDRYGTKC